MYRLTKLTVLSILPALLFVLSINTGFTADEMIDKADKMMEEGEKMMDSGDKMMGEEGMNENDILKGNVICLLPEYKSGTVKPVIATSACDGYAPHAHVILDTRSKVGNVYAVQGSPEAINRLQQTSNRKDVEIKGKISGNATGWVITVE